MGVRSGRTHGHIGAQAELAARIEITRKERHTAEKALGQGRDSSGERYLGSGRRRGRRLRCCRPRGQQQRNERNEEPVESTQKSILSDNCTRRGRK
jgi:hypothetical protein